MFYSRFRVSSVVSLPRDLLRFWGSEFRVAVIMFIMFFT